MPRKQTLRPEQVVAALNECNGLVYLAADKLRCVVQTVYNYAKRYKVVAEAIAHQKGKRLDTAELSLWNAILAGEAWAVCFYLKCQGKHRGYVERQEVEHSGGMTNRLVIEEESTGGDPAFDGQTSPATTGVPPE